MPQALRQQKRLQRTRAAERRRLLLIGVPVVLVSAAVITGVVLVRGNNDDGDDDVRSGSIVEPGLPVEIERDPAAYRIDYRVESRGGERTVFTSDRVTVRRPFERRLESYDGARPRGRVRSIEIVTFDRLFSRSSGSNPAVLARSPGPADLRLPTLIPEALRDGLVERRERRLVAGRPCQVYRSAALLTSLPLSPLGDDEHADTCVDEAGLMLEEVLVVREKVLLRRVATAVDEDGAPSDDLFAVEGNAIPPQLGGGAVQPVTTDSRPPGQPYWQLDAAPAGFTHRGRYAVAEAAAAREEGVPGAPTRRLTYIADVYVRGTDVVVVDQGGSSDGTAPFPDPGADAATLELGDVGRATVLLTGSEVVLRVDQDASKFVRVRGSVSRDELVTIGRALRAVPEGTIVPLP